MCAELLAQHLERHTVLQRERNRRGKGIHQAADGRPFLRHLDENFARLSVRIQANGDVAFMTGDRELMRERRPLLRQAMAHRARRRTRVLLRQHHAGRVLHGVQRARVSSADAG